MSPLLERALGWLRANTAQFSIVNAQSHPFYSIKPVAELAEAADVLSRTPATEELGRALLAHAWAQFRDGDLIAALLTAPTTLVQAAIYMPFRRCGLRNEALEAKIRDHARMAELVPPLHRLPVTATLTLLGIPSPWSLARVIDDEWTARMSAPTSLTPTDLYMATHIAFYAADYGRHREGLAEIQVDYFRRWLGLWLEDLSARGQCDLVAELLIAAHCAGDPNASSEPAWKLLETAQRPDGSVPFQTDDTRPVGVAGMTPEREHFLRDYHSTLVTIMAASVCSR